MPMRSLGLLALVFALIFALQVAAVVLPWQPLDPAWQWRLATTLINAALLPLLALALLQVGVFLAPADPILRNRHRLFRQFAVAAALGFLLLLPLQFSAGLRQQNSVGEARLIRISRAQARLDTLRQITARATSNTELNTELQKLQGPVLGPADLANPLPLLKAQVNAVFDQAQIQINRDRASLPPASASTALPELLRNGLSCLLLTVAFPAFARRPRSERTVLEETLERCKRWRVARPWRSASTRHREYIRQLSGKDKG